MELVKTWSIPTSASVFQDSMGQIVKRVSFTLVMFDTTMKLYILKKSMKNDQLLNVFWFNFNAMIFEKVEIMLYSVDNKTFKSKDDYDLNTIR